MTKRTREPKSPEIPFTVFYSWQTDLPTRTGWGFVHNALEKAEREINREQRIRVQLAARGEPGSPNIIDTILERIRDADCVVADVSIVNARIRQSKKKRIRDLRLTPNPNVLFELGYAVRLLGWDRIILVYNTDTGTPEDLPFDFRPHSLVTFSPPSPRKERERFLEVRTTLGGLLTSAVKSVLRHGTRPRGLTWMSGEERGFVLADAHFGLWRVEECLAMYAGSFNDYGELLGLPPYLLPTRALERSLEVFSNELDKEDAVLARQFVADLEAFNCMASRIPVGLPVEAGNIAPTVRNLRKSVRGLSEFLPLVRAIIEYAEQRRPDPGERLALCPYDKRPYTLPEEDEQKNGPGDDALPEASR